jgi:hypothetical protein
MSSTKFLQRKRNRVLVICGSAVVAAAAVILLILFFSGKMDELFAPSLTWMSPAPVAASDRDEIVVDVVLSSLPDRAFPAASISVDFDRNKLDFLEVKQGTMMTLGVSKLNETTYNIPIWTCDTERSNELGVVNAMYLDTTGGKFSYVQDGFNKKDKDVMLRLAFRLRDSAMAGDTYSITFRDAVIATIGGTENKTSLATSIRTLKTYPAKIVVE